MYIHKDYLKYFFPSTVASQIFLFTDIIRVCTHTHTQNKVIQPSIICIIINKLTCVCLYGPFQSNLSIRTHLTYNIILIATSQMTGLTTEWSWQSSQVAAVRYCTAVKTLIVKLT